jgi:hypothetical protein
MTNRKLKFNFVDVLILLILAAAVALVAVVFVGGFGSDSASATQPATIEYVVEIKNLDSSLQETFAVGQLAEDAVERKIIGEVKAVSKTDSQKINFNYTTGEEEYSVVEGKIDLTLTIRAQAEESETSFTVNGYEVRVGKQISIILPGFQGSGYCIGLTKLS